MTNRLGRPIAVALAALCLLLVLAGCGGGDSGDVASVDGSVQSADDGASTPGSDEQDPDETGLEFARCMREQGIDFPDPDPNGRILITPDMSDQKKFDDAEKACGGALRSAPGGATPPDQLPPEQQSALQDANLEFAKCMREQGIDIPDPSSGGPGGGFALELPQGVNPGEPDFDNAQKTCQPILEKAMRDAGLEPPGGRS